MFTILVLLSLILSSVYSASCGGSTWEVAYSSDKCTYSGGQYTIKCENNWDTGNCGMRLDGTPRLGEGTYQAKIKAADGEGLNSAFYLFSYGRNNDKSYAWNEIDIEILGKQISGGQTKIWTNVWTGYYTQHGQFVTVNWDASAGFHTYVIKIDGSKIYWIFDGTTVRTFTYTGYSDLRSTIDNLDFQAEMVLWGANDNSWPDMGGMYNNDNSFPQYAYFKSVKLTKSSSFTEAEGEENSLHWSAILAISIISVCFVLAAIGGSIWYLRKRKGGRATFDHSVKEDSKEKHLADTPVADEDNNDNNVTSSGYDMTPVVKPQQEPETIEVDVAVET